MPPSKKAALTCPPPSTKRLVTPSFPKRSSNHFKEGKRPLLSPLVSPNPKPLGDCQTATRFRSRSTFAWDAWQPTTMVLSAARRPTHNCASTGMRARLSNTKRRNCFCGCSSFKRAPRRTVKLGSSARTVLIPTKTASLRKRIRIPSRRASAPVIHLDSPEAVAILPSKVIAALMVTNGRRCAIQWAKPGLSASASLRKSPWETRTPASRRIAKARPACLGLGSSAATTTRPI